MVFSPSSGSGFLVECGGQPHSAPALGSGRRFCRGCACLILPQLSYLLDGMQTGPFSLRTDCKSLDKSETSGDRCPGGRSLGRPPRVGVASVARLLGHLSQCPKDQPRPGCHHRPPQVHQCPENSKSCLPVGPGPSVEWLVGGCGPQRPTAPPHPTPPWFSCPCFLFVFGEFQW